MFKTESKTANREKYYCRECQTRFDTLDQREPKNGATINAGLAAKLDKMDPEDL